MAISGLFDAYAFLFSRKIFYRLNRGLFHAAARGLGILNYKNEVVTGEQCFLKQYLSSSDRPTVLDVGSNEGSYTDMILAVNGSARVFAFEPHPTTYNRLAQRLAGAKHVTAINAACGSACGQLVLYDHPNSAGSCHASLHAEVIEKNQKGESSQHVVDVIDLDTFSANQGISVIDLLKIDTEGHELEVLKGAATLLRENRIKAIQFEFNEMNIVSRVFFKDFCDLLPDFRLYRMVRDGLVAVDPSPPFWSEIFAFQNIVALPRNTR